MIRSFLQTYVAALVVALMVTGLLVPAAGASETQPTVREVAQMVTCPSCSGSIESDPSPAARRMRAYIREKVTSGWTRQQILDGLVAEYGGDRSIIIASHDRGRRSLLTWGIPVLAISLLIAAGVVTIRRWRAAAARQDSSSSSQS